MSFSRAQHIIHFRPMVARAWAPIRAQLATKGSSAYEIAVLHRVWYEKNLKDAIGVTTTNEANAKADFEKAMAHFELIAGDGIEWQLNLFSGDARRVMHEIRDLCRNFDIDESYARQALKRDSLPDIGTLDAKSLVTVLRALKIHSCRPSHAVSLSKDGPTLSMGRSQRPQRQPSRQPSH